MPYESLVNFLEMFPYFFDKKETSNFFKSQSVTNKQFQDIYNDLFFVYESFHLDKRCLVWKEQSEPYYYTINFVVNFPLLKRVSIYKNDELIYIEQYNYSDGISNFIYSYEGDTLDDISDNKIVPDDRFVINIETYEEYYIEKGYPENDIKKGDIFDHDYSLDIIGEMHNIPRKKYNVVEDLLLQSTEPPYNKSETENDYYYMNRIINYLIKLHTLPLPIVEVWKLYGFEPIIESREKYLMKFFDLEMHPNFIDESGEGDKWFSGTVVDGEIIEWTPEQWEHQDKFCEYIRKRDEYFFVEPSTRIPTLNQSVVFLFTILDMFGEKIDKIFTVDIYLNEDVLEIDYDGESYELGASLIDEENANLLKFVCKDEYGEIVGEEETTIQVRGCNNADLYVSIDGDDNNNGRTLENAFASIQKAFDTATNDDLIVVTNGEYELLNPVVVRENCTLLGCGNVTLLNEDNIFFTIPRTKKFILTDISLNDCETITNVFENNNKVNRSMNVIIRDGGISDE